MTNIARTKWMDDTELEQLRTVTEARAVIDARAGRTTGPLAWVVIDTATQTGLRVGELALLRVCDLDRRRRFLRVERTKKRKNVIEQLPISKSLASHLAGFIGDRKGDESLFVGKRGPLGKRALQHIWTKAVERARLPKGYSIHAARHTMAVKMLKTTNNLRMVQLQLGHSSPVTTANMYADVPFEDRQGALEAMFGATIAKLALIE